MRTRARRRAVMMEGAAPRRQASRREALHGFIAALILLTSRLAGATTVQEVTFDEMCARAEMIFVGSVADVRSTWVAEGGGAIETAVRFADIQWLHGEEQPQVTLRFSGGELDGRAQRIAGMPRFRPGERVAIFARGGRQTSPIVGFNQGCFEIVDSAEGPVVVDAHGRSARCRIDPASCSPSPGARGAAAQRSNSLPLGELVDAVRARVPGNHR